MIARRLALVALPLALGACDWFTDFKQQPSVGTWQEFNDSTALKGFRGQPSHSVGTNGTLAPGYGVSYQQLPQTIDSLAGIQNPTKPDARSLLNGRKYFTINCAVCHGVAGDAKSTLAAINYGFAPSLLTDQAKGRSDGRTVVIVPEIKDGEPTGLSLLHVRLRDDLPLTSLRSVLQGYRNRYAAIKHAVTETEPVFRDDLLADIPVLDLMTDPVNDLAERWRS